MCIRRKKKQNKTKQKHLLRRKRIVKDFLKYRLFIYLFFTHDTVPILFSGTLQPCPRGQSGLFPNCIGNKTFCYSSVGPNVKVSEWYVEYRQYLLQCPAYKSLSLSSACFFFISSPESGFSFWPSSSSQCYLHWWHRNNGYIKLRF